jgi:glyoxylase-like metal-dependent hydrolase (beta-lactamase superfamily II)
MANNLREFGDACWTSYSGAAWANAIGDCQSVPVADDMVYIVTKGVVGNVTAVKTSEGLVVFDSGSVQTARKIYDTLRAWDTSPIHTIIITHGHVDHVMGLPLFDAEAKARNHAPIRVIGQRNMLGRFARYTATTGFNSNINARQFGVPGFRWPSEFRAPDQIYDEELTITVGGHAFELHHGMGETDDHTWTWIADRKTIVSGDFVIWAAPNCGNPQKVQRYCKPWAEAFRGMTAKQADVLVPGHGPAIFGADRVRQLLGDGARLLDTIHDQTVALMNQGKTLDEVVAGVKMPADLLSRPYFQPTYDDPEFLVRNIWRLYGGWWDGDPAHLKPAPADALARELAALAGGAEKLAQRARELADQGDMRVAGHLIEFAVKAAPDNVDVHKIRIAVSKQRAAAESTLMARGVFHAVVRESQAIADPEALAHTPPRTVGIG